MHFFTKSELYAEIKQSTSRIFHRVINTSPQGMKLHNKWQVWKEWRRGFLVALEVTHKVTEKCFHIRFKKRRHTKRVTAELTSFLGDRKNSISSVFLLTEINSIGEDVLPLYVDPVPEYWPRDLQMTTSLKTWKTQRFSKATNAINEISC